MERTVLALVVPDAAGVGAVAPGIGVIRTTVGDVAVAR